MHAADAPTVSPGRPADADAGRLDLAHYPTPPTQLLTATRGWAGIDLAEVWRSRELLASLAWRDVRARYKQTVLGLLWVVAQPLLAAGIFSFVFTAVADVKGPGGVPYFLVTFTGLMAFNGFSGVLNRASGSLVVNSVLVSKIYFPRLILPLSTVLTVAVDFAVVLGLLAILVLAFWHPPGLEVLLMPVCVALLWGMALGIGMLAAAVAVSYRDVMYVVPVATQFLMWASAVLFPMSLVKVRHGWLLYFNPLVSLVEGFRWSVLGVGEMRWDFFAYSAGFTAVSLVVGALAFRRMERRFADVI